MCSVFLLLQSFALLQLRQTPEELRRRRFLRILQQLDLQSSPFWPRLLAQSFRPVVLLESAKVPWRQNLLAVIRKQRERSTLLQFDAARRTICQCRLPLRFQRMLAQIPWKRHEPFTSYGYPSVRTCQRCVLGLAPRVSVLATYCDEEAAKKTGRLRSVRDNIDVPCRLQCPSEGG